MNKDWVMKGTAGIEPSLRQGTRKNSESKQMVNTVHHPQGLYALLRWGRERRRLNRKEQRGITILQKAPSWLGPLRSPAWSGRLEGGVLPPSLDRSFVSFSAGNCSRSPLPTRKSIASPGADPVFCPHSFHIAWQDHEEIISKSLLNWVTNTVFSFPNYVMRSLKPCWQIYIILLITFCLFMHKKVSCSLGERSFSWANSEIKNFLLTFIDSQSFSKTDCTCLPLQMMKQVIRIELFPNEELSSG